MGSHDDEEDDDHEGRIGHSVDLVRTGVYIQAYIVKVQYQLQSSL